MDYKMTAASAAKWALSKVGCSYSQAKRTNESIFDCSSLVARAYSAQGKRWKHGGEVPISMYEVYDDDFELLWPESYAEIGKRFSGSSVIKLARQAGDLQFICTDSDTTRSNKITHVAMVSDEDTIVHARSTKYGVCTNSISHYSGKICAVTRYNPVCALRSGMCGWRTLALQKALNANGADLNEDGEFGSLTCSAVKAYQLTHNLEPTGIADAATLRLLLDNGSPITKPAEGTLLVTGKVVNVRKGPGTEYDSVIQVRKGERLNEINYDGWRPIDMNGDVCWISEKYISSQDNEAGESCS